MGPQFEQDQEIIKIKTMVDQESDLKSPVNDQKLTEVIEDEILTLEVTPAENRKVLLKIDLFLMPLMFGCYLLQTLDKGALSNATMMDIREDTGLHGKQYSWVVSVFYFGYLGWSFPSAYLMNKFPIGKYVGVTVMLWAVTVMCMAACRNYGDLVAVRFFLGVTESAVAPAFTVITSLYYKRNEQPLRQGLWFLGNAVALVVSAACAYGISLWHHKLANWKYLFLIYGAITFAYGLVMFFAIPDSPTTSWFLSEREREVAVHRVLENKNAVKHEHKFKWDQGKEALMDPQAWLLSISTFASGLPNGGVGSYSGLIINGFGYSQLKSLLMGSPSGALMVGFVLLGAVITMYIKNTRMIVMIAYNIISLAGLVAVYCTIGSSNRSGRLGAYYLVTTFAASLPMSLSVISSNVAGFSKKTVVSAMLFIAYCVGNIIGPQMFSANQAPQYKSGMAGSIAGFSIAIICLILLQIYYIYENRRRDRLAGGEVPVGDDDIVEGLMDRTDRQNSGFRYVY